MDVTVSHLNERLAMRLPTELPLGLVFVTGRVANLGKMEQDGRSPISTFTLLETDHQLRCVLSERAATEVDLKDGDFIRAGGHLAFDSHQARYYLLARDIEVVETADIPPPAINREMLRGVLADVQKRAEASKLTPAELPVWLKKLAHLEEEPENEAEETAVPPSTPSKSPSPELVARLSAAMDSEEDVEVTPEMTEQMTPSMALPAEAAQAYEVPPPKLEEPLTPEKPATPPEFHSSYTPPSPYQVERSHAWWIFMLLLITFIVVLAILAALGVF